MVAAYHLIFTAYGWWLPNDPRGSMSTHLRCDALTDLGELHYGRRKIQPAYADIQAFYERAREILLHPLLRFNEGEIEFLGMAFAGVVRDQNYTCYACAIMPDHVHVLIRKHRHKAEQMIDNLQQAGRRCMIDRGRRDPIHPVWGGPGWKVYLETQDGIRRVAKYIERNPMKAGRPPQHWPFVVHYDGWMPGQVRIVRAKPQA
jgi:REP element-mobilizing transposase RayT